MSKRARVPAPFRRLHPSVIRGLGPRLLLVGAGCAALLLIGGSSYVLAQFSHHDTPIKSPQKHVADTTPGTAQVLGAATAQPSDSGTSSSASTQTSAAAQTPAAGSTAPAATPNRPTAQPLCALTCVPGLSLPTLPATPPSFDLVVDSGAISRSLTSVSVPFHVVRHGGLTTPIQLGSVSVRVSGSLSDLLHVSSAQMLDSDHGRLTLLSIGLPLPSAISLDLHAESGGVTASTSFTYRP